MMSIKKNSRIGTKANRVFGASLVVLMSMLVGGCGLVDPQPTTTQPVTDVRTLYYPFDSTQLVYTYLKRNADKNGDVHWDTLSVGMQGQNCPNGTPPLFGTATVYNTLYTQPHSFPYNVLYAVDAGHAYAALEFDKMKGKFSSAWLDLKAPIQDSATWQFSPEQDPQYETDTVTARVAFFDVTVKLDSVTYSHVTAVDYTDVNTSNQMGHPRSDTTKTTSWFAQGIGLVYFAPFDAAHNVENGELRLRSIVRR